jgi:hypothetical protein
MIKQCTLWTYVLSALFSFSFNTNISVSCEDAVYALQKKFVNLGCAFFLKDALKLRDFFGWEKEFIIWYDFHNNII